MTVTPLYAGLLALWFFVLSWRVVARRRADKINLGDGGDMDMQRRIRGHGNFAEYVPLGLILIGLLEMNGTTPIWLLHLLGLSLLVGRLLHGYALSFTEQFMPGRVLGMVLTFLVLIVAGVLCAWHGLASLMLSATA
ncbi:MAG: MAPEG family protein [Panacagrimonas sp.]